MTCNVHHENHVGMATGDSFGTTFQFNIIMEIDFAIPGIDVWKSGHLPFCIVSVV